MKTEDPSLISQQPPYTASSLSEEDNTRLCKRQKIASSDDDDDENYASSSSTSSLPSLVASPNNESSSSSSSASSSSSSNTTKELQQRQQQQQHCRPSGRRLRARSANVVLTQLANTIVQGQVVVFVTGAGLSVASGIPPFRSGKPSRKIVAEHRNRFQKKNSKLSSSTTAAAATTHHFAADSDTGLQEGVWDQVVWTTATKKAFRQDPIRWYNNFWWPHLGQHPVKAKPNAGHHALDDLLKLYRNCKQVTQNIDGLQRPVRTKQNLVTSGSNGSVEESSSYYESSDEFQDQDQQLIEIHGRVGLYKCMPDSDSDTDSESDDDEDRPVHLGHRRKVRIARRKLRNPELCPYQYLQSLETHDVVPVQARHTLLRYEEHPDFKKTPNKDDSSNNNNNNHDDPFVLKTKPRCPVCGNLVMPQALLFDEGYHAHSFYQFELAEDWLRDCQALVFVGTSFAVRLTAQALQHAREQGIPVYNFNVEPLQQQSWSLNVSNVVGPAHETLPQLLQFVQSVSNAQQTSTGDVASANKNREQHVDK